MNRHTRWKIRAPSPLADHLAEKTGLSTLQSRLLVNRGIHEDERVRIFVDPSLAHLADPLLFQDMDRALEVALPRIERREKITVFGDYDADGLTATAVLAGFLAELGCHVDSHIPDRLNEGYGLNRRAVKKIADSGSRLMITVDCGVSNMPEIELARELGMAVIVTDHHQLPEGFSPFCPVINPQQEECAFPYKSLAGVGVAFYFALALRAALRDKGWFQKRPEPDLKEYLDLVALGTVADGVPLLGINRILVKNGLRVMTRSRWPGLRALIDSCGIDASGPDCDDLAFRLAPRLNAPGRIDTPDLALDVLMADDPAMATGLSDRLNALNTRRQEMERFVLDEIKEKLESKTGDGDSRAIVMADESWHQGVLGIVASRLAEEYQRPVLLFNLQDGMAKGSGRSVRGFDLYRALCHVGHYLERFGGHSHAAGFTASADKLPDLKRDFEDLCGELLSDDDLVRSLDVDAELKLEEISFELLEQMEELAPFGSGNPEPLFQVSSVNLLGERVVGENHLKMRIGGGSKVFDAIGFGLAGKYPLGEGGMVDMLVTPGINRWQGKASIQLRVTDIRPSGTRDLGGDTVSL